MKFGVRCDPGSTWTLHDKLAQHLGAETTHDRDRAAAAEHKRLVAERKAANRGEDPPIDDTNEVGPPTERGVGMRRREQEVYGMGSPDPRKRPPGAGTAAIPKKVG